MDRIGCGNFLLETTRLGFRQMTWEDRPAVAGMLQDREVMYAWEHAFSDGEVDDWIEKRMAEYEAYGNFGYWAVILKKEDAVIGQCGLTRQKVEGKAVLEVGYMFSQKYWHHGYAAEAAQAVRDDAFQRLRAEAVYSIIRENNAPSIRVAERNGMKPVGKIIKIYRGIEMPHIVYRVRFAE